MTRRVNGALGGFTLLEIIVALAVAAIGLAAVSKALIQNVNVAQQLEERTLAGWVASNRLAELRVHRQFRGSGHSTSRAQMAGHDWRIEENYYATANPDIVRVLLNVFLEGGSERPSAVEIGYLARYQPAKIGA